MTFTWFDQGWLKKKFFTSHLINCAHFFLKEETTAKAAGEKKTVHTVGWYKVFFGYGNDPSAGSPTETLLRLLLPLNDQVWASFRHKGAVASSEAPVPRPH